MEKQRKREEGEVGEIRGKIGYQRKIKGKPKKINQDQRRTKGIVKEGPLQKKND